MDVIMDMYVTAAHIWFVQCYPHTTEQIEADFMTQRRLTDPGTP
jgi:hypothetical protein